MQLRTTNDDPAGTPAWSAWKDFVIGDYTARAYQFRIILFTLTFAVTPEISSLEVKIDMPDRTEAQRNLTSLAAGSTISFINAFKATPAIGVTGNNLATGDYFTVTSPAAAGFSIRFFNSAGTGVARNFDYLAKGHGKT